MKKKRYCLIPFTTLYINKDNLAPCCLGFLKEPIFLQDNVKPYEANLTETWNCQQMQDLRESIIEGDYRFCSKENCTTLSNYESLYELETIKGLNLVEAQNIYESIRDKKTFLDFKPEKLMLNYDEACNLACPSCRYDFFTKTDDETLKVHENMNDQLDSAHGVYMSGLGDPFVSKGHRDWLLGFSAEKYPSVKTIYLHTNGQLLTQQLWEQLGDDCKDRIKTIEISVDAATKGTYSKVRKGGDFSKLIENLTYLKKMREDMGYNIFVNLIYIVQTENYKEIVDFIKLNDFFKFDLVSFYGIRPWQHMEMDDFKQRNVCSKDHPEFKNLVEVISHERLSPSYFKAPLTKYNIIANFEDAEEYKGINITGFSRFKLKFLKALRLIYVKFRRLIPAT